MFLVFFAYIALASAYISIYPCLNDLGGFLPAVGFFGTPLFLSIEKLAGVLKHVERMSDYLDLLF